MAKAIQAYLVLYNASCLVGWAYALYQGLTVLNSDVWPSLEGVWAVAGPTVLVVQSAMILEIFHAGLGFVRSPVFVTAMQVTSRLWVMLCPAYGDGSSSWTGMMVISWAAVEVIRYSFYLAALLMKVIPYPIFYARYSAFAILYPTGIAGELGTAFHALQQPELAAFHSILRFIMYLYVPGGPFMYMNMVGNRKNAFKKRFAPPPKPERGCAFPQDKKGTRSTTAPNRAAIAAAIEGCGPRAAKAAKACATEKSYRFGYARHVKELVRQGAYSPQAAIGSAQKGLDYMYANFEFVDRDGNATPFIDAMKGTATVTGRSLKSVKVQGTGKSSSTYEVPYDGGWHPSAPKPPTSTLSGAALTKQLDKWASTGIIERDAADAVQWTADYVQKNDLSDAHFVLIGAGSAMGPCAKLLELGANVVAIDIPGSWGKGGKRPASGLWKRLFALADKGGGTLTVPVDSTSRATARDREALSEAAGCDLMMEPREIGDWLKDWMRTLPKKARVCIGNYTYLDGALHVKLALCADYLIQTVLEASSRLDKPAACAFLCTPTDAHLVPSDVAQAASDNFDSRLLKSFGLEKLFNLLTMGSKLRPNVEKPVETENGEVYLVDGLSVAQGPNYALAKRMQHWRAVSSYESGHVASTMVAPSTATISVIHNKTFAWAYGGMPSFGFEIFKQETTNAVMSAVLVHDVLNDKGPKNPTNRRKFGVDNALKLFSSESVHGGLWRAPYTVDSLGEASALIYFAGVAKPALMAAAFTAVAMKFLF